MPFPLQAGCRKRRLNLALVFFVFILCYFFVFLVLCESWCFGVIVILMLSVPVQLIAWEDRPRNDRLCVERDVKQLLTQSLFACISR